MGAGAMTTLPPLPAGFQLETAPAASGTPALPPGFQLEGDTAIPPAGLKPGSREYADWAAAQARAGKKLPQVSATPPAFVPPEHPPVAQDPSILDRLTSLQNGAMQGMTFGLNDEIDAGLATPIRVIADIATGQGFDPGRAYQTELANWRSAKDTQEAKAPGAAEVGDVLGSLVTGKALTDGGVTLLNAAKPTIMSMAPRMATEGAAYAAANGFGRSDGNLGDRLAEAGKDAGWGALTGAGVGTVAGALARRAAAAGVPSVDELKADAGTLYDAAKNSGVTFSKPYVQRAVAKIVTQAMDDGLDAGLHGGATAAVRRLASAASQPGMTVQQGQTLRRVVAAATKDPMKPDQARIAGKMLDSWDQFLGTGAPELEQANAIYHQAKNGERIETAIELAGSRAGQYSGSGFENALRTEFRAMERQIIKGKLKGLSQDEIDAISKVARGGPLETVSRWLGKLAPTGVVSAGLGSGVPFIIGNALGGPALGAAASGTSMGVGFVARALANALAKRNANMASLVARNGGTAINSAASGVNSVVQALLAGASAQSPKLPALIGSILPAVATPVSAQ